MMRYLLLDAVMLALIAVAWWWRRPRVDWRKLGLVLAMLLALTVLFDNLLIWLDVFHYAPRYLLGWRLGRVPVEDLAYAVGAVLLVPLLWGDSPDA